MVYFMARNKRETKIAIDIPLSMLENIIRFIFSENSLVNRKSYHKIKELFSIVDESPFQQDRQMEVRFFMIKNLIEGYLTDGITDFPLLAQSIMGGQFDDEIQEIYDALDQEQDLSNSEITYIDGYISDRLQYAFLYQQAPTIEHHLEQLRQNSFDSLKEFNMQFKDSIALLYKLMLNSERTSKDTANDFITSNRESIHTAVEKAVKSRARPGSIIHSGIKMLNKMFRGGFQAERGYMFLGLPSGWKSCLLLSICLWTAIYNKDNIVTKDPTKIPCVLYVTQENSINETIERLLGYFGIVDEDGEIAKLNPAEVIQLLVDRGFISDDVAIAFKYRRGGTITTADIESMIYDLQLEGYEVVMVVHDYIKKIRSSQKNLDRFVELGEIVNEFCAIAKEYGIPFIAASQMTRGAISRVEQALSSGNKTDFTKLLGASDTGESILMFENIDAMAIIGRETSQVNGKCYLTMKRVKLRGKDEDTITYFAHPFEEGSSIRLQEDYGTEECYSLEDLSSTLEEFNGMSPQMEQKKRRPTARINKTSPKDATEKKVVVKKEVAEENKMDFSFDD